MGKIKEWGKRTCVNRRLWSAVPTIAILLLSASRLPAASFSVIYNFQDTDVNDSRARLVLSSNMLYGTAISGGSNFAGGVFSVGTDGTQFTNLYSFDGVREFEPATGLVLVGNSLYGTTTAIAGTVGSLFKIDTDANGFVDLYDFPGFFDGVGPASDLVFADGVLYGTTEFGSSYDRGTIYGWNLAQMTFTNVHILNYQEGFESLGGMAVSGDTLYGTTSSGGSNGNGNIFSVKTDGSGFTNLYEFSALEYLLPMGYMTNGDGATPRSALVLCGNTLYGAAAAGGIRGEGTIFRINTDGSGFTNLHNFQNGRGGPSDDGASPWAGLTLASNQLFGITASGGGANEGMIFSINADGTGFTNLHSFTEAEGFDPLGGLIISGHTLFGTTSAGGMNDRGSIFALNLLDAIPLNSELRGSNLVLNWSNPVFSLQCASVLNGEFKDIVGATSPYTNQIIGDRKFFRLRAN